MSTPADDPRAPLRRSVYWLLIALSTGVMLGRILAVDDVGRTAVQEHVIQSRLGQARKALKARGVDTEAPGVQADLRREEARLRELVRLRRPFLSANDRSRWCTLRALVEQDMRVEGAPYAIDKVIEQPNWDTIDMVKHDGHVYSSKPPLLPTLVAAPYWLIHRATGATLGTHPYAIGRFMLILVNVVPLVISFWLLARLVERLGTTDWGRMFVMGAATFGTFLTTFAVVLNNHLPAAVCVMAALYAGVRIWLDGERRLRYFVIAGLFGAFTVACELPALALVAVLTVGLAWKAPRQTVLAYLPAALLIAAGFFGTNWIAHRSLRPPYMHRSTGKQVPANNGQAEKPWEPAKLSEVNLDQLEKSTDPEDWYDYYYVRNGMVYRSYWVHRVGIDRGEPSPSVYALHVLVGHHGLFSLTPVWILTICGLGMWMLLADDRRLRELALAIAWVSLVCGVFYLTRPQDDRNYGGMTSGFRWMFWFAPLWLVGMLPAVDWMSKRRWAQAVGLVLLALSVLSASYPTWNPWTHPWILDGLHDLGYRGIWVQA
jgi:hypothetical protein